MKKKVIIIVISLMILLAAAFGMFVYSLPKAKEAITLEVGSEKPSPIDFLESDYEDKYNLVKIESGMDAVDMFKLGDYPMQMKVFFFEYETMLHVVDTVAPEVMGYSKEYVFKERCYSGSILPESSLVRVFFIAKAGDRKYIDFLLRRCREPYLLWSVYGKIFGIVPM